MADDDRQQDDGQETLPEFRLIERLKQLMRVDRCDVRVGIGDDAAVVDLPAGEDAQQLVTATDTLTEGTHFVAASPPASLGHRVLAVNLSDLAAMGATPAWASLSLSLPKIDADWLDEFATGFASLAEAHGVQLIGGDTVSGPCSVTVTLQGLVPAGQAVLRSGAKPGDRVYVTGMPGAAAAGRRMLEPSFGQSDDALNKFQAAFLYPQPRVAFGQAVAGYVTAMIDVSDGLSPDLGHLLRQSGVGAELKLDNLQLPDKLATWFDQNAALDFAMFGGEDYELLFTVGEADEAAVERAAHKCGCELTCLGSITGRGLQWSYRGEAVRLRENGFRHFEDE